MDSVEPYLTLKNQPLGVPVTGCSDSMVVAGQDQWPKESLSEVEHSVFSLYFKKKMVNTGLVLLNLPSTFNTEDFVTGDIYLTT